MDHFEMVETLREKANVSYEEASAALEKCNWDLLDALLMLEGEGRLNKDETKTEEKTYTTRQKVHEERKKEHKGLIATVMHKLAEVIKVLNSVYLKAHKDGEERLSLSMTVIVLALLFAFWAVPIAMIVAMCFGYRFSVKGLSIDESVNAAMDKAGTFVGDVVKAAPNVVTVVVEKHDEEAKPAEETAETTEKAE